MTTKDYKEIQHTIPTSPGVYRFWDKDDTILYVGKAKNLKKRLNSYFGERENRAYKTRVLVKNADHIDFVIVDTEHDALLLENAMIKKHQPRYNVMLKDGKSYTYIVIKNERFPRVFFTRKVIKDGSLYFGPYTSKWRAKQVFDVIKKLFPLRNCKFNLSEENIKKGKFKVCLEYHIKNCEGPCQNFETEANYNQKIDQIKNILRGRYKPVKDFLVEEMQRQVENLEFENAQLSKERIGILKDFQSKSAVVSHVIEDVDVFAIDQEDENVFVNYLKVIDGSVINSDLQEIKINVETDLEDILPYAIEKLREKFNSIAPELIVSMPISYFDSNLKITVPQRGEKKQLLDLAYKNLGYFIKQYKAEKATKARKQTSVERIIKTMQKDLNMDELPYHIECFDNSNIQGSHPVASCVVFKNAKPSKKDYRHYNIKTVEGPNDFASMEEIVMRRYKRLLSKSAPLPQLIIIDGGKGQLNSAMNSIKALGLEKKVTVIGIAKRLEEIYFASDPIPLHIDKKSETLKIIQQARNEAHRFAITFHRDKRSQSFLSTGLMDIKGIGEQTATSLLSHFGSLERVKNAKDEDLVQQIGKSKTKLIREHFAKTPYTN